MTTATLPSVAQMRQRSNSGHRRILRAVADNQTAASPMDTDGGLRGLRTCYGTLRRWDCITADYALTDRGRDLLTALETGR